MQVMIDIETLASTNDAVVLQIGACTFHTVNTKSSRSEQLYAEVDIDLNISNQIRKGRSISHDTIGWWFDKVEPDARRMVFGREDAQSVQDGLTELFDLIKYARKMTAPGEQFSVWANSPSFDLRIIENLANQYGMEVPWKYSHEMDVRTIRLLNESMDLGVVYKLEGHPYHDALTDAINQARFVEQVIDKMSNSTDKMCLTCE